MPDVTSSILFKFIEPHPHRIIIEKPNQTYEVPAAWFRNIEPDHEKNGVQYCFPTKHPDYSDEIQNKLTTLEPGDTLSMKCIARNNRNTKWRAYKIKDDTIKL